MEYGQANDDINSCLDTARADDATDSCLDTARAHDVTDSCQDTSRSSSRSLYSRVTHEEYDVMFLVMSKLSENDIEAFELIVDCSGVFKAAMNKIFWEKKGFQRELQSVVCKSLAKQTFNISLPTIDKEGTIEDCTKASIALQFHPLRPNFIKHKLYCERSKLKQLLSQIEIAKQSPPINELSDVVTEKVSPSVILLTVFKESEPSNKDNIQRKVLLTDQLKSEITGDKLTPSREYENNEHDLLPENKLDVKGEICNHGNEDLRLPLDELQSETEVEFTEPIEHRETVEVKDEPTKGKRQFDHFMKIKNESKRRWSRCHEHMNNSLSSKAYQKKSIVHVFVFLVCYFCR